MPLNLQLKAVNMITVCLCIFHQNLKKRIPDTPLCYLCDTWLVLNLPASVSSSVKWGQCGWYPLHRVVVKTKSKQNTWTSTSHDEHLWPSHHQWGWGTGVSKETFGLVFWVSADMGVPLPLDPT